MSGIRLGDVPDIARLCELGAELLEQSVYAGIKPDRQKFQQLLAGLMGSKDGIVLVVVDDDDQPQGFLLGIVDELFFSRQKYATDIAVYVREGFRNHVRGLYRRFMKWANNKPRLAQISLGLSSGIGDPERVGKFYEKMLGIPYVGGIYMKRI